MFHIDVSCAELICSKFHFADEYLYTTKKQTSFLPVLSVENCYVITARMCKTCSLKVSVNDEVKIIRSKSSKWTEHKYVFATTVENGFNLETQGGGADKFWAIGGVRTCSSEEKRAIKLKSSTDSCTETNWSNFKAIIRPENYYSIHKPKAVESNQNELFEEETINHAPQNFEDFTNEKLGMMNTENEITNVLWNPFLICTILSFIVFLIGAILLTFEESDAGIVIKFA